MNFIGFGWLHFAVLYDTQYECTEIFQQNCCIYNPFNALKMWFMFFCCTIWCRVLIWATLNYIEKLDDLLDLLKATDYVHAGLLNLYGVEINQKSLFWFISNNVVLLLWMVFVGDSVLHGLSVVKCVLSVPKTMQIWFLRSCLNSPYHLISVVFYSVKSPLA